MEFFVGSHYLTMIATQLDAQISSCLKFKPGVSFSLKWHFLGLETLCPTSGVASFWQHTPECCH